MMTTQTEAPTATTVLHVGGLHYASEKAVLVSCWFNSLAVTVGTGHACSYRC